MRSTLKRKLQDVSICELREPFFYEGEGYYTIGQLSKLIGKSESAVCKYITRGLRWGKLKACYLPPFGDMKMIPVKEITKERFPYIGV